jgi:AcrR family transcriptional regulator
LRYSSIKNIPGGLIKLGIEKIDGRTARAETSRRKILASAMELFLAFGFKETTITMISKKADIGYGTAYAHFPVGKDDIFLAIMAETMEEFYRIADTEYTVKSKAEAFAFVQKNIENFLELAVKHQGILKVFHEAIGLSQIVREKWEDFSERFLKRIAQNVENAIEKGLARNPDYDPEIVASVLFYTGEKYLWKAALNKTTKGYQTVAKNLAQMYTNGLYK